MVLNFYFFIAGKILERMAGLFHTCMTTIRTFALLYRGAFLADAVALDT